MWEWTSSPDVDYPYDAADERELDTEDSADVFRVLRGGSWGGYYTSYFRAAYRLNGDPNGRNSYLGFRCARSRGS